MEMLVRITHTKQDSNGNDAVNHKLVSLKPGDFASDLVDFLAVCEVS
jgi:hypothetical protein